MRGREEKGEEKKKEAREVGESRKDDNGRDEKVE